MDIMDQEPDQDQGQNLLVYTYSLATAKTILIIQQDPCPNYAVVCNILKGK